MLSMSQIETIREMYQQGKRKSEISKEMKVSRPTVDKVINQEDFSEKVEDKIPRVHRSKLDPYKEKIDSMLQEEKQWYHKQHYTAKRIWILLVTQGADELKGSYDLVLRYVKWAKGRLRSEEAAGGFLKLVWHAGEAQADFGEADYYDEGGKLVEKGKYLVLSFPYSNRLISLYMPGENCECVCQGLQYIFEYIGRVPNIIVFDNATGIGKRIQNGLQENGGFTRFRLHYGFQARFCNPYSGNEKGNVENCVGTYRRNCMVPPLKMDRPMKEYDQETMLRESFSFRENDVHYEKNKKISELFQDDMKSMHMLPQEKFNVARIDTVALNAAGSFCTDNGARYVVGPSFSNARVILEKSAWEVKVYTLEGKPVTTFQRQYGPDPELQVDLYEETRALRFKANAWGNSLVREKMADGNFKSYLDEADNKSRRSALNVFTNLCSEFSFGDAAYALDKLCENGRFPTQDEARLLCSRLSSIETGIPDNPTNVDLKVFDNLMQEGAI